MKLVSAILPVFNERLGCLRECIRGVLNQSYGNVELIIVDDSTNEKMVNFFTDITNDDRVVYVHNQERIGFVRSLNKGLSIAKGNYMARVDSDDIQRSNRFELQVAFLEANPDIGIVGSSLGKINDNGEERGIRHYPASPESIKKTMMLKNAVAHPSVMIRRQVLADLGCYDESFIKAEDYEMWMRAVSKGIKIANIAEPLVKYRISNVEKRDNVNWVCNLRVKLRYFVFDRYLFWRIAGIAAVGLMVILPSFVKRFLYSMYNRIA